MNDLRLFLDGLSMALLILAMVSAPLRTHSEFSVRVCVCARMHSFCCFYTSAHVSNACVNVVEAQSQP